MSEPIANLTMGDFTFHSWFKTTDEGRGVLFGTCCTAGNSRISLELHTANRLRFYVNGPTATTDLNVTLPAPSRDGKWHVATAVRRGATHELWFDGEMVSITDLPGDRSNLYVLRDREGDDGKDRVDILSLDGGAQFDAFELAGTDGVSITDTSEGTLFAVAANGISNVVDVDEGAVHSFRSDTATHQSSVTNLDFGEGGEELPVFFRGDADNNGRLELTDGVFILNFLFTGGAAPTCSDAADADDSGLVQLTDGIVVLGYLFLGGPAPSLPGPPGLGAPCGPDVGVELGCVQYSHCP
jgi:hypothetical protein